MTKQIKQRVIDQGNGVFTIDTGYQRSGLVASHLIQQGDSYAFVDVGTSSCLHHIQNFMKEKVISLEQIEYIMVTHVHLDHAGAAGVLMKMCPEAKLIVHPRGARHMVDPSKLIAGATAVYGEETLKQTFGEILPVEASRVIEVEDEQTLLLNGRAICFLDTPGHAKHHYCVFDETSQGFFTGDTFGLAYEDLIINGRQFIFPTTTPVQFDPQALHQSIDRMLSFSPERMFLTHFGCITDVKNKADTLHRQIDDFVILAEQSYSSDHDQCFNAIYNSLTTYLMAELESFGCQLNKKEIMHIMKMDLNLNAQGLCCWLEYKNKY